MDINKHKILKDLHYISQKVDELLPASTESTDLVLKIGYLMQDAEKLIDELAETKRGQYELLVRVTNGRRGEIDKLEAKSYAGFRTSYRVIFGG